MNKPYLPRNQFLTISFQELETVWEMLAAHNKFGDIKDSVEAVRALSMTCSPMKALHTMLVATAWLADDGTSSGGD